MRINGSDPETIKAARFNHRTHFSGLRHLHLRQQIKQGERLGAIAQIAQCKFRDYQRMDRDLALDKMLAYLFHSRSEVINPDRAVRDNQCGFTLRRLSLRRGTGLR